jgi:sugar/nucleoside kinase (ribokinase family)
MGIQGIFHGLLTVDFEYLTESYPPENSKTKALKFQHFSGGPATNSAIAFAHLGGIPTLYTAIGKNPFADIISNELRRYNVHVHDYIRNTYAMPTFASVVVSRDTGERTVFSYHPESLDDAVDVPEPVKGAAIALIDGFHMQQALKMARYCAQKGIPVVFDGGSWKNLTDELLSFVDIAICSANFFPPNCSSHDDVIHYLQDRGVGKIAITRGKKSIMYSEGEANMAIEVADIPAADTLAAGDVLHGAFCHFYAKTGDFEASLRAGSEVATESCRYFGPREWMEKRRQN